MAASQSIRSRSRSQSRAHKSSSTPTPAKKLSRRRSLPLLPPPLTPRRGGAPGARAVRAMGLKTTIRRYANRSFHRMEEIKGKIVDFVEFYTSGDYHAIDL